MHPLLLPLVLAIALPVQPLPRAPRFDAIAFFSGVSQGDGRLKIVMKGTRPVRVRSTGRVANDGTLILDQRIVEGNKPPRDRQWRIRAVAPGRYAGTLTDAVGPMTGTASGDRLHLAFRMKGGLKVDQRLTLAGDRRSARNIMTVRKFGITVARLDETIRKRD